MPVTVPIPLRMQHRPRVGGCAVPYVNIQLADGGADFAGAHRSRMERCWTLGLCQSCGERLTRPMVLLCGPDQLASGVFDEPPLHPECARYAMSACPMINGERSHFRASPSPVHTRRGQRCPEPDCDCGGWVLDGRTGGHVGRPAHAWYAVWVGGYHVAVTPEGTVFGGAVDPADYRRVRGIPRSADRK